MKQKGFSLIEVMIAVGLLSLVMLAATTFFAQQLKANNFLEFQAKREQLRLSMLGQVLNNSKNCKCLFNGAANFPSSGTTELTGFNEPIALGKFEPDDCSAGIPSPLVNQAGMDGLKLVKTSLQNITAAAGSYGGDLMITIQTTKEVVGPKTLLLKIPVAVLTSDSGAQKKFEGCANSAGAGINGGPIFEGWPNFLNCGGTIFTVSGEGIYSCYGGGDVSTRSAYLVFNKSTRRMQSLDNETDKSRCLCGECCSKSIEELIAAGLAR